MLLVVLTLRPWPASILDAVADDGLDRAVAAGLSTVFSTLQTGIVVVVSVGVVAAVLLFRAERSTPGRHVEGAAPSPSAGPLD